MTSIHIVYIRIHHQRLEVDKSTIAINADETKWNEREWLKASASQSIVMNIMIEFAFKLCDIISHYTAQLATGYILTALYAHCNHLAHEAENMVSAPLLVSQPKVLILEKRIHIATHYNFLSDETKRNDRSTCESTSSSIDIVVALMPTHQTYPFANKKINRFRRFGAAKATIFRVLSS